MRSIVIILGIFVFIVGGCGQSNTKRQSENENNKEAQSDTLPKKVNWREEWNFEINPPKVGLISTKNRISEIPDLLPTGYSMVKDSTIWDDMDEDESKWEYSHFYAVRKNGKNIFEIYPNDNKDEIYSIVVLSPEYKVKNTELRVGSTLGTLKKTFSIKNWDFSFDFGLYIYCNGFNGTFSIDLEKEGTDDPNLLDLLPDSKKIETIVVY